MTEYFGEYRIDNKRVEHGCCWGSAIVRDCTPGEGMYGKDVALICECSEENAEIICEALNAAIVKARVCKCGHDPIDHDDWGTGNCLACECQKFKEVLRFKGIDIHYDTTLYGDDIK